MVVVVEEGGASATCRIPAGCFVEGCGKYAGTIIQPAAMWVNKEYECMSGPRRPVQTQTHWCRPDLGDLVVLCCKNPRTVCRILTKGT